MKNNYHFNENNIQSFYGLESINKKNETVSKEFILNSRTYGARGEIPTIKRSFSFMRNINISYDKSTFIKDTNLISISEYPKSPNNNKKSSMLQQLNQALDKGVIEFVEVICASQIQKETFKKKQTPIKSFNFLKILTKFFSLNTQNYKNGSKNCVDEFNFYSDNRL